jgi:hypothetical protein
MRSQYCLEQAEECLRLMRSAKSEAEARVLRDLANSWKRLAGQMERYRSLARDTRENPPENPFHAR